MSNEKVVPMETRVVDRMEVLIYRNRDEMGKAAGQAVAESLRGLLNNKSEVRIVFAAAPSQNEFLATLVGAAGIDWKRVVAFHLDEYIGLADSAPQRFARYLDEHIFGLVPFKQVHYLNGNADLTSECRRYSRLLAESPLDIACIGIGENGHIAFNDPHVADFSDPELVKVVELDQICREQQVHDGCFDSLDKVPKQALTLTIPAIFSAGEIHCVVPAKTKCQAVRDTIYGPVSPSCPATILRRHLRATLYLDADAAGLIRGEDV